MIHLNMRKIPPDYVMKRWTKVAKGGSLSMKLRNIEAGDSLNSKSLRFNALSLKVQKIPFEASKNFESYQMACEKIDRLVEEIISLNKALKEKQGDNIADDIGDEQALSMRSSHFVSDFKQSSKIGLIVKDPPHSQCKGRRKPERFKSPVEKYGKKLRICANCKKNGHNVQTCTEVPLAEKISKKGISESDEERETNYEGL
ncbi:uncharacterized protein LOC109719923 [Ananas comosus]|uniref:Uncharacterized protein LOC109719923 n=1 Tax=Ananas comosus TaxID=4615 RepID=A0A6P5GAN7_ANACO|nr:uncharacterized protein LOC109719923 [Ananas comosus]